MGTLLLFAFVAKDSHTRMPSIFEIFEIAKHMSADSHQLILKVQKVHFIDFAVLQDGHFHGPPRMKDRKL